MAEQTASILRISISIMVKYVQRDIIAQKVHLKQHLVPLALTILNLEQDQLLSAFYVLLILSQI